MRGAILAFVCMASFAALASAETPKAVNVPAGDLIDAVESLAKQYGVDVIYPSGPLKGRTTPGLSGTLEPMDAFKRLLDGTPLTLSEEGGALLITQSGIAPAPDRIPSSLQAIAAASGTSEGPIAEVEIEAWRGSGLSALRAEIERLESQFYDRYNKANADHQYDVDCTMRPRPNSHFEMRFCEPAFVRKAVDELLRSGLAPPDVLVRLKTPEYQKNMVAVVTKNPELVELLKQHSALVERYNAIRRQKSGRR